MRRLLRAAWAAITDPGVRAALGVAARVRGFYRTSYLAGLASGPLLERLAQGPASLDEMAQTLRPPGLGDVDRDALESWISLGLGLGVLGETRSGFSLRSRLARQLARPESDAARAFLVNLPRTHAPLLADAPDRIRRGAKYDLADLDSGLIARSSLTVEFAIRALMDEVMPTRGRSRLLEVGCGSGAYMRHAAERNPDLTALGVDLSPEVVDAAREELRRRGLAGRAEVRCGDIRGFTPDGKFDVVTLHNVVYYFPVTARVSLYEHLRGILAPGGVIVTTTWCRGSTPGAAAIDLWFSMTEGCGRLPTEEELLGQIEEAGIRSIRTRRLIPFEEYVAFLARER
jgi:4-hydroxy-2,2'-bipyrrole-5-carbaldehyde O-methyltransferase